MANDKYSILLVDDSDDDRLFLRIAIRNTPRLTLIAEVNDGEAAIAYLEGRGKFSDREKFPLPDAMFLDLKMPRKTGHEVLEWMQSHSFDDMLVAVVSGSFLPEDIERSMALGADAYFKKHALQEELQVILGEITQMLDK